jgi:hypothetical protein
LVLKLPSLNVKHNPFYGGSFNGNDCLRLLRNHELLFKALKEASTNNNETSAKVTIEDIVGRHEKIFCAFSKVVPLFRASPLLTTFERATLLEAIDSFWELYNSNSTGSITIKIHHLFHHCREMLIRYGTIGLFAEDAMESIHAIVNLLACQYAALDGERRATQIIRQRSGRKSAAIKRSAERKEATGNPDKKRKRGQHGDLKTQLVRLMLATR